MKCAWMKAPLLSTLLFTLTMPLRGADTTAASNAINALGIDLLRTSQAGESVLYSPYSIQDALAMTYAGAAGSTRDEMARVLHFPKNSAELNNSFAALGKELAAIETSTRKITSNSKEGGPAEPVTFAVANRLYGQEGFDFREPFQAMLEKDYGSPLEKVDFKNAPEDARKLIDGWVEGQTQKRITDLIPPGGLDTKARLVLVDAVYLKAAWAQEFWTTNTRLFAFHGNTGQSHDVPTMNGTGAYGYVQRDGYTAVGLPYIGSDLQLLVLLPDDPAGLPALESRLTPGMLASFAMMEHPDVDIWLPKIKMESPAIDMKEMLMTLGLKAAFDEPTGSADFDGIAPRKPNDYLRISNVFHKTFLSLDEHGTEAAAATAAVVETLPGAEDNTIILQPKVYYVHVDHPFLFAIQDCKSGACFFLGRITRLH
jgi:serpin B